MRRVIAFTATAAVVAGLGVVLAAGADASVTTPGNGATIHGTVTLTESPGGSDSSTLGKCSGIEGTHPSTSLSLINSGGTTVFSTSNGGGALSTSISTENYPNGSYTVRGVEHNVKNGGFLGLGCSTSDSTFNNAVQITNQKTLSYSGDTGGVAGTSVPVSATVTDPNAGGAALSGQSVTFALSGGASVTVTTNGSGVAATSLPVAVPPRAATLTVSTPATSYFTAASTSVPFTVERIPSTVTVSQPAEVVHGQQTQFSATVGHDAGLAATGQVQFTIDGNDFGAPVTLTGDTVQSGTTTLGTGDHTVVAKYLGDANYLASTSNPVTQHVGRAPTTTTVDSSLNPAVYGQPITFTGHVRVLAPGVGDPTGAIQFTVDGNPFGTAVPLDGDSASLTVPSLGGGNHDVTATYNGDQDFASSTSAELTQGVDLAGTRVTVHSSAEPSVSGQPVTFSVDVSAQPPGFGTPTGAVQFSVDGDDLGGPVTLDHGSATSPALDDLTPGTHVVLADYRGDANFSGELGSFTQHVGQAQTNTSISATPNPSVFGQPVTFSTTVSAVAPGSGTPTGQVQFSIDGVASGAPVALVDGSASSAPVTDMTTGTHAITVDYLGSTDFATSRSDELDQTVNRAKTSTALSSSADPSVYGQPVTFTATVSAIAPGAGNPTGTITFTDGSTTLGSVDVGPGTGEQASVTTNALGVGPHAISASYSGDGDFQASSDAATQTVHRAQTSTVVTSSVNPAKSGQAIRFTAVVSPVAPGAGVPTGAVTFTVNGAPIGSPVSLSGGSATSVAFSSLSPGTYDIQAAYAGDANFVASSAKLDQGAGQDVSQAPTSLDLTATPNPAAFGDTVSFTATVAALAPATGRPSGVVDFYDGADLLGAVSLAPGAGANSATAAFTSSTLTTGSHAIRADYLGNFNFTGQSASLSESVGQVPTVTGLTAAPSPAIYGQSVALTAVVSAAGAGAPQGSVTFRDGATVLGTAELSAVQGTQQAMFTVPDLHAGGHHFSATYSGSVRFAASTSVVVDESVQRAASTLVARSFITDSTSFPPGAQIYGRVQATLTGNGGAPLAGQTLVFSTTQHTDGSVIHICTVVTDDQGTASCDATTLFPASTLDGGYDVNFAGSADYAPASVHQEVNDR